MLTLSSGLVIISNQFYVIFHDTNPQIPVQHMSSRYFANIKRGCNVNVETVSALVFSYAGINLTSYYLPLPPGAPGAFAPKCVPSPRVFA